MLTIVKGRTFSFDATIFDTYVAEGDPGNVPTNHTGWTIRSQIRKRVGNVLVANLNVTFPVPVAGTVAIRHDRVFTRSLPVGDYWWDIVATDPSGNDHVYVEPEPIAVHNHPTDPANATYDFVPGGGGAVYHTHSISDITGLQALLNDRLPPDGGTTSDYLRGDNTWQALDKSAVGLGNVENVTLSTWSGSSSITQLGTIVAGSWQGSRIAPAYLGDGIDIETKFLRGDGSWQMIDSTVTTSTATNLNGYIFGNGTNIAGATAAAVTSDPNTLVLRDGSGASEFGGVTSNGAIVFNGVDAGDSMTFNMVNYFYGTGAAAAHRTALGLGTADTPTFAGATFSSGAITASQPLALTQTWNNAAVTFTGLQVNVTDTASATGSLVMDLRLGGTSVFTVNRSGGIGVGTSTWLRFGSNFASAVTMTGIWQVTNAVAFGAAGIFGSGASAVQIATGHSLGWSSSAQPNLAGTDLKLFKDAASTLAQRNGDGANAAQTFRLYNTFSGSTNFERLNFRWDSSSGTPVAKIGTEKGSGGGVARDLVLETDGTERARISAAGVFTVSNIRIWNGQSATSSNVAVGPGTLIANIGGSGISCFGSEAMAANTYGNFNVAFGENSLSNNTTGSINVAIGNSSGRFIADGTTPARNSSESVFIGASARPLADNQSNQIAIGRSAIGLGSNTAVIGNDSITLTALKGNVAIGATIAPSKLTVTNGDAEVATIGNGLILKSPDGTRYRVTVANGGALTTTPVI